MQLQWRKLSVQTPPLSRMQGDSWYKEIWRLQASFRPRILVVKGKFEVIDCNSSAL